MKRLVVTVARPTGETISRDINLPDHATTESTARHACALARTIAWEHGAINLDMHAVVGIDVPPGADVDDPTTWLGVAGRATFTCRWDGADA